MARPKAPRLTERELEIMQVFWDRGDMTAAEVRDELATRGRDLAYTTVATLIRILHEKGFVEQTTHERPFRFQPACSQKEVSGGLLGDLLTSVFGGSRERLLVQLMEQKKLTAGERAVLEQILKGKQP